MQRMNELAFYTLAGAPRTPRDLIAEVQQGESLGLGSAFISERLNIKEAATVSLPPSGFEQAVSLLEGPEFPLTPWAFRFTEDERELVALYLPYTDKDWFESGPPDAARVEHAVAGGDAMVCRWDTGSGEPSEGSADKAALLEEYRRELACPDILKKPLRERFAMHNWPGVKSSGEPGMINWLFWKLMMHRLRRQSRQLERLGRDALDGE